VEPSIEFNQAAFKHGVTEADIRYAFKTFVYEEPLEDFENKHLVIGFDTAGNPLEVMYNIIDDETINVFHAMRCRNSFTKLI
jgi:hypothetical protein